VAIAVLLGVFNLPYFGAPKTIGGPELFPLNGPQYTLFLELFVNVLWWATRRMNQLRLAAVLAAACFLLLSLTGLGGDIPETFWSGFPRVGASFFAGVVVFHVEGRVSNWRGWTAAFWGLVAVMAVLFYMPLEAPLSIQLVWVAVLSPLLVLTGTRARLSSLMDRVCLLGGALSYPVYCLHYPLFSWINGLYRARLGPQNIAVEGPLVTVLALAISFAVLKLYDEPVRHFLTGWLRRPGRKPRPVASPLLQSMKTLNSLEK
jgi:peptidoglycan/LPS O-acetylase OafA/YrhL